MKTSRFAIALGSVLILFASMWTTSTSGEEWLQYKYDERHSGNVPGRSVEMPLGLVGAV